MAQPSSTSGGLLIFYFVVAIGLSFHLAPKEQTESYHPEAKKKTERRRRLGEGGRDSRVSGVEWRVRDHPQSAPNRPELRLFLLSIG